MWGPRTLNADDDDDDKLYSKICNIGFMSMARIPTLQTVGNDIVAWRYRPSCRQDAKFLFLFELSGVCHQFRWVYRAVARVLKRGVRPNIFCRCPSRS